MPALNKVIRYSFRQSRKLCLFVIRKKTIALATNDERRTTNQPGFTLIELMVAIVIVAILSTIGIIAYSQTQRVGRDAKRKQDLRSVAIALELFYQSNNKRYPCSAGAWQDSRSADWMVDKTTGSPPGCPGAGIAFVPAFINPLPLDPVNTGSNLPAVGTGNYLYAYWQGSCSGVNSYALIALLENSNDADSVGRKNQRWCDNQLLVSVHGWNPNTFLISSW